MSIESSVAGADVASQVSVAVARKAMDLARDQGDAALDLLKSAADVAKQSRGAVSAAAGGQEAGQSLDVTA